MANSIKKRSAAKQRFIKFWPILVIVSLFITLAGGYVWSTEPVTVSDKINMVVYKTPACGCCDKWVTYLRKNNFNVKVDLVSETNTIRTRLGVPREMASCHTAMVGDYWVEGHVPADLIQKLLNDQPEGIQGIAAPGMPRGSPGMESPKPSKYKILSVNDKGETEVYAIRDGQNAH